ncbi:MAG: AAA family ATPase [Actinomycetota bacterium]|nr:AAA family ATPase [Actinomycetota bacterium]
MARVIHGRESELQAVDDFLDRARASHASLIFEGDAGIGKTTIWDEAVVRAGTRCRVLVARPAEAEAGMAFAALTDLFEPVFDDVVTSLPQPQARALAVALLKTEPEPDGLDRRAIAAATLSVLRACARTGPVVVAIDDLQWLDRPSQRALSFALRRVGDLPVGLLACSRTGESDEISMTIAHSLGNHQRVGVGPLAPEALRPILEQQLGRTFSARMVSRIGRIAAGNPFFALELARLLPEGSDSAAIEVPNSLRSVVEARIADLPDCARGALLVVAANGGLEVKVLLAALPGRAEELVDALERAHAAQILHIDGARVTFCHPLFAAAVYSSAPPATRRQIHARLAGLVADVEERARHLALGAAGPNSDLADALSDAAERARRRGAPEVAAQLAEHARALTPTGDETARRRRSVQLAEYRFHAGELAVAREILVALLAEPDVAGAQRAEALRLLGEIRYLGDSFAEGIGLLAEALQHVGDNPSAGAAIELRLAFGILATADYDAASRHAHRALELAEQAGQPALLAEALASVVGLDVLVGRGVDQGRMARALQLEDPHRPTSFMIRPSRVAASLEFYAGHLAEFDRRVGELRARIIDSGEETDVPFLDGYLTWSACWRGDLRAAAAFADEAIAAADGTGSESLRSMALGFGALPPAFAGDVALMARRADEAVALASRTGRRLSVRWASWARALVALAQDDPQAAHAALGPLGAAFAESGVQEPIRAFFLPDEITALVALGRLEDAERLLEAFQEAAVRTERRWALMLSDRCRALVLSARDEVDAASAKVQEALDKCADLELQVEVGRTLLVAGQIERRRRRKGVAADHLGRAVALFESAGARLWAERARTELGRVGLRRSAPAELTPSELRVAEVSASGLTNREVAAQLFISAKTVEANLARIYRKLDIRSRAELGAWLASSERASPQT